LFLCLLRFFVAIVVNRRNDATALILYRFAVAAVSLGAFSFGKASSAFAAIVVGEIVWGLFVGWLMLHLRAWVRDPRIEITLSIITPYLAYWPPEHLGGSGVLATVTAGLFISWNGLRLISAATRLQGIFFWDLLIYVIEGMVFVVTGLQARTLISSIKGYSLGDLVNSALVVCVVMWAADLGAVMAVLYAVDIDTSVAAGVLVLFAVAMTVMWPSTPAQVGALEVGALTALDLLHVGTEAAFAFALLYHVVRVVPVLAAGLVLELRLVVGRDGAGAELSGAEPGGA